MGSVVMSSTTGSCAVKRVRYDTLNVSLACFGGNADPQIRRVCEQRSDRQQGELCSLTLNTASEPQTAVIWNSDIGLLSTFDTVAPLDI